MPGCAASPASAVAVERVVHVNTDDVPDSLPAYCRSHAGTVGARPTA